jgi:hypothetical protein
MPEPLKRRLAALAQLSSADRAAILRQLSSEERKAIAKLMAPQPTPPTPPLRPAAPACSPWLAKRLTQLLERNDPASITDTAHAALRHVLGAAR